MCKLSNGSFHTWQVIGVQRVKVLAVAATNNVSASCLYVMSIRGIRLALIQTILKINSHFGLQSTTHPTTFKLLKPKLVIIMLQNVLPQGKQHFSITKMNWLIAMF
jgi:hypothetical protein